MNVGIVCYLPRHMTKIRNVICELTARKGASVTGFYDCRPEPLAPNMKADDPNITRSTFNMLGVRSISYDSVKSLSDRLLKNNIKHVVIPETHNLNSVICGGHIVQMCRENGITTTVVQHGQILPQSLKAFIPMNADTFCAWGDWTKRRLVGAGAIPDRITVTGCPELDELSGGDDETKKITARRVIEIDMGTIINKPIASIIMHSTMPFDTLVMINAACQELGYYVVAQAPARYNLSKLAIPNKAVGKNPKVYIAAADVCITGPTTAAIECIGFRKPTLLLNPPEQIYATPFAQFGTVEEVQLKSITKRDIVQGIANAKTKCNDQNFNSFTKAYMKFDGKASKRVCDVILRSK